MPIDSEILSRGKSLEFNRNANNIDSLQFSTDLAVMFGFDPDKTYVNSARQKFKGQKLVHMTATINNVFVYCNLLEYVIVVSVAHRQQKNRRET